MLNRGQRMPVFLRHQPVDAHDRHLHGVRRPAVRHQLDVQQRGPHLHRAVLHRRAAQHQLRLHDRCRQRGQHLVQRAGHPGQAALRTRLPDAGRLHLVEGAGRRPELDHVHGQQYTARTRSTLQNDYSLSDFDQRKRFTASGVWELPDAQHPVASPAAHGGWIPDFRHPDTGRRPSLFRHGERQSLAVRHHRRPVGSRRIVPRARRRAATPTSAPAPTASMCGFRA